jgi:hypothetical protein
MACLRSVAIGMYSRCIKNIRQTQHRPIYKQVRRTVLLDTVLHPLDLGDRVLCLTIGEHNRQTLQCRLFHPHRRQGPLRRHQAHQHRQRHQRLKNLHLHRSLTHLHR